MSIKALENHLKPLAPFLQMNGVTEICINNPQEIFVEINSKFTRHEIPEFELGFLESLAELVAEYNQQEITPEKPLLSASLPTGERTQFVMSPACEKNKLICSIRRHAMKDMSLIDYSNANAFKDIKVDNTSNNHLSSDNELIKLYETCKIEEFIKLAIRLKKNIIISGGTGTGKTTFLNACLKEISDIERLITIEDTREVQIRQPNAVHLIATKGEQGLTKINMRDLFECALRLRPDRIFLSELRGEEAFAFLRAANSGHPGSLSTVHADTPQACFDQLIFMMQQAGTSSSDERLLSYIKSIVHIVVQLKRCPTPNRFMYVSDIYFNKLHN